eukprot:374249-Prorocentrum_minimum.AAC.1
MLKRCGCVGLVPPWVSNTENLASKSSLQGPLAPGAHMSGHLRTHLAKDGRTICARLIPCVGFSVQRRGHGFVRTIRLGRVRASAPMADWDEKGLERLRSFCYQACSDPAHAQNVLGAVMYLVQLLRQVRPAEE